MATVEDEHRHEVAALLDDHAAWRARRADLSAAEPDVAADAWHESDDAGCDLAAELLRLLTDRPG